MSTILWANNAGSTLAGPINSVATSANLAAGTGALFPNPGAGQYFVMTFTDAATGLLNEIVHVTAVSTDTITIVRAQEGTTALSWAAGDLANNLVTAGTLAAFIQTGSSLAAFSLIGTFTNLVGNAPGSAKTASWTVDGILAGTALGGTPYKGTSLTLSFNGAGTGLNGMDTGSTPTSADLYVYAIYNPVSTAWGCLGTIAGSGAIVYGGSNLPAGFTASALIWTGKTDGSGNILNFTQLNNNISVVSVEVISAGSATSYTALSLASVVPVNAKLMTGWAGTSANGVGVNIAANSSGAGNVQLGSNNGGATDGQIYGVLCPGQQVYYKVSAGTTQIWVSGYTF